MLGGIIISAAAMGLVGGIHCASMCGGMVAAFSKMSNVQPVQFMQRRTLLNHLLQVLPYHLGRIISYALLGALFASIGPLFWQIGHIPKAIYALENVLLIIMGVYLICQTKLRFLSLIETFSLFIFQRLQPVLKKVLAFCLGQYRPLSQFILGMFWGLIPCGMVYGALAIAAFSGNALGGFAVMLAFGIGTLPNLILIGELANRFRGWIKAPYAHAVSGTLILTMGCIGFFRLFNLDAAALLGYCFIGS
ncbi:MAG: sulfite exporter TauE/SafE family protein [Pseudomonadota bacterium]